MRATCEPAIHFVAHTYALPPIVSSHADGAGTFAGADGSRAVSEVELDIARHQGKHFAGIATKLAAK